MSPQNKRTFFITSVTDRRRALLQTERSALLFIDVLRHYQEKTYFQVHEFVVMPDHFHLILTPAEGVLLEKAVQYIKGGYWHRAKQEFGGRFSVWQASFTEHRIKGKQDYDAHRNYIYQNPVKRGLVKRAEDFPYSSARMEMRLGPPPEWIRR